VGHTPPESGALADGQEAVGGGSLHRELATMDVLCGCTPRSILAMEALWPKDGPVPWGEAYMIAKQRARLDAHDHHDGRTVAFLEGLIAATRLGRQESPHV
jgi:hypothetical protein